MGSLLFSASIDEFIRLNRPNMTTKKLTEAINEKFGKSYTYRQVKGHIGYAFKGQYKKQPFIFTKEQEDWVVDNFSDHGHCVLARLFNKEFNADVSKGIICALLRRKAIASPRKPGFKKGNVPANKGMKGTANSGSFKKGHAISAKAIGSTRTDSKGYKQIKIGNPRKWVSYAKYVYEKHFNIKLQEDEVLLFKDGDRTNFNIENLVKMTRNEMLFLSSQFDFKHQPEQVKDTAILLAKLEMKTIEIRKGKNESMAKNRSIEG